MSKYKHTFGVFFSVETDEPSPDAVSAADISRACMGRFAGVGDLEIVEMAIHDSTEIECESCHEHIDIDNDCTESQVTWQQWQCPCCSAWNDQP